MICEYRQEQAFQDLFSQVLRAFPQEILLPSVPFEIQTHNLYPHSFDEVRAASIDLQRYRLKIPRNPQVQDAYTMMNLRTNSSVSSFEHRLHEELSEKPAIITTSQYPYEFPGFHEILWYKPDTTLHERATIVTELFLYDGVGKDDFVIVTNPQYSKSIPNIFHSHLFIRGRNTYRKIGNQHLDY